MTSFELASVRKIHCIGIGGIGISAIARMMHAQGKIVTGNDLGDFPTHHELAKLGITISIGKTISEIPADADLVVYSVAWNDLAPELLAEVKARGTPLFTYPEMLGLVSQEMYTIAVAGTHGKTTTTAMIAKIMRDGALDPTVIVGSLLKEDGALRSIQGTNFIAGKSNYFLVEADEYRRAFLNLSPKIVVITNIDLDHLDYYKDLADIQSAFGDLVAKIPADGYLICDPHDPHVAPIIGRAKCQVLDYVSREFFHFKLKVPGAHNVLDAKAAFLVGEQLSVSNESIARSLENFAGTWRRFDFRGETSTGVLVYDDYAHNPQKVCAALDGARELYPDREITVVFQPHLYSRTKTLLHDFATSFGSADHVIISPIYASREAFDPSITASMLVDEIRKNHGDVIFLDNFEKIEKHLISQLKKGDVLLTVGAGDITKLADSIVEK